MGLLAGLAASQLLTPYVSQSQDQLFRLLPLPAASEQIVIIAIAQADLDFFKEQGVGWPWPRELYVPLLEFCARGGAKAVVFDLLFTEPSVYGSDDDQRLAHAMARVGTVILPFFLSQRPAEAPENLAAFLAKNSLTLAGGPPSAVVEYHSILLPLPSLVNAARLLGNVQSAPDPDGIFRRLPLVVPFQGRWLPSLALAAYLLDAGPKANWEWVKGGLGQGQIHLPLDHQGQLLLKFRGPSRSHPWLSAANVIQSEIRLQHGQPPFYEPTQLRDKYVLVGATAPGLMDLKPSPLAPVYPGVEFHATALDNLLQGDFLRPVPAWGNGLWALLLASSMVGAVLLISRLALMVILFLVGLGMHLGSCALLFLWGWLMDPLMPGLALILAFTLTAAWSYATTGRQKAALRQLFSHYMSAEVLQHLLENPEKVRLGGERRHLTVFFSDLAGFTTISEGMPAEDLVHLLNEYLAAMTDIILEEQGTVDKFEGDAIMAFWGAPLPQADHALRACRAALWQQNALAELNRRFIQQGWPRLACRIGLHTGEAVVGNLGSKKRFDYTVIGDTVNLASRLEGLNKFYGTHILASETTMRECGPAIEFLEIDWVAVKGREQPVTVYQPLGFQGQLPARVAVARTRFAQGLALYREGRFGQAATLFQEVRQLWPDHGPAQIFWQRCQTWQKTPLPANWDAVFRPEAK